MEDSRDRNDAEPLLDEQMREEIRAYFSRYPNRQAVVLPALHIVQDRLKCVPDSAVVEIAEMLELAPAEVHDALSFYGFFRSSENPLGELRCWVCRSVSCAFRGGEEILEYLCKTLDVKPGQTSADGRVTVEFAECLGGCDLAPCLLVDGQLHEDLSVEKIDQLVETWGADRA